MAEALDAGEDVVGGLCPPEGLEIGVVCVDEDSDVLLRLMCRAVDASPDLLVDDEGEDALDLIDPRCAGGEVAPVPWTVSG